MTAKAVLIVDDETYVLSSLRRLLRNEDYSLRVAASGREGLELLAQAPADLVVSDQRMPTMTGVEFLQEVKQLYPETIRVILSGYADVNVIVDAINKGEVFRFLTKPWNDEELKAGLRQCLAHYDIRHENKGLLECVQQQNDKLSEMNEGLAEQVDQQTVQLRLSHDLLRESRRGFQEVLASILDLHEPGLRGHSLRVAHLSRYLATLAGCSAEQIDSIEAGGLLHDIGKLSLPGSLLQKPSSELSAPEREKLARHPLVGYELLKAMPGLNEVALMVRHHHESSAGKGYPDGLAGDDIPLGARIVAVVNRYDHYRYPPGKAVIGDKRRAAHLLKMAAESRLDTRLVDLFLAREIPDYTAGGRHEVEVAVDHVRPGMVLSRDVLNSLGKCLLREGAEFTEEVIEQLCGNAGYDPVVSRIFVNRDTIPEEPADGESAIMEPLVEVPLEVADSEEAASDEAEGGEAVEDDSQDDDKPLVFIVDDEQAVLQALTRELHRAGYQVEAFTQPLEAIRQLRDKPTIHALVTDFNMPGVRGDRFLVQAQKECPGLPCIVITGFASRDTVALLGKSARITRILSKPWRKEELLKTLANLPSLASGDRVL